MSAIAAARVEFGPGRRAVRIGRASIVANTRVWLVVGVAVVACAGSFVAAVVLGDYPVPADRLLAVLLGQEGGFSAKVVLEWRLPRAVAAIVLGAALGVSGALFQSVTRNPLGSPDVLGLGAGAFTGALIATSFFGGAVLVPVLALVGGLGAGLLIGLLAYRGGLSGIRFVIAGIAVASALTAVNTILLLRLSTRVATTVNIWGQGTLENVRWSAVVPASAAVLLLMLVAGTLTPAMRQLELGDTVARGSGLPVERSRILLLLVGVLLTAIVTSVTGPIAFVALVAPQLARLLAGSGGATFAGSAALGALLLSLSDVIATHLLPTTVPVGVVTAVIGGVYLLGLIIREARRA